MIGTLKVAVVVPAYRVESQIAAVLGRIPPLVDHVFVVDDASPDGAGAAAESLGDPRIRVIRHEANQGVGGAMATGFRHALAAQADLVVKCDGDGQMDPADIPALLEPLLDGRADYAKGCRFHHGPELTAMPWVRRLGNVGLTFLNKVASGYWHVLDPQNGFVAIGAPTLRRLPMRGFDRGYFFENDMLIRLNAIEARVIDVPLPARYADEPSSLRPWRTLVSFPPRLVRGFFRRVFLRYVFYDVSPVAVLGGVGALLFTFGSVHGGYHWIRNALEGRLTPAGTVVLSAVSLILGFQLLLQALVLDIQGTPKPTARGGSSPDPVGHVGGGGHPRGLP